MEYEEILKSLAPCGLNCQRCLSHVNSEIKTLSQNLQTALGNFDRYAERFSRFMPVFNNYPQFKELLGFFTQGSCCGCRSGDCKYPNCGVAKCYQVKGVDFCFQCAEFPCDHSNLDPDLHSRWLYINTRMKTIGIEAYFQETKDAPRYL
ncbi:hypothetical protein U27_03559 [Candidatus Vecturithrix granuli]|uniref:DUF3795 domain-containing protein n=1 Tax=Vecturithrix granuli TaxID=1499967 RepID=A0A081BW92_VECG1|nr:hypothetical protein U27_03559 [Candidatus Vecturithrix granuli]